MAAQSLAAVAAVLALAGAAGAARGAGSAPACPAAIVHFRPHEAAPPGLRRLNLPWVGGAPAAQKLIGLIWYWPTEWRRQKVSRATIYTHGHAPSGEPNMKILWAFLAPRAKSAAGAGQLVVKGRRLDGPGKTWQQFVEISYSGQSRTPSYASIIDLPTAGCWELDATAGPLHGSVVFRAIG